MLGNALLGALLTYTFTAMPFDDGGTLSGSFTWDSTADTITAWDLIAAGGTFPDLEYTTANSWKTLGTHLYLDIGKDRRRLRLAFQHGQSGPGLYAGDNINTYDTQETLLNHPEGYSTYRQAAYQVFGWAYDSVTEGAQAVRLAVPEQSILAWIPLILLTAWRFSAWSRTV